jgi:PAS domain S-box-containing protein
MDPRVLIISDSQQQRDSVADRLKGMLRSADAADTALAGLQVFCKTRPPAVVVDWNLPGSAELIDGLLAENRDVQILLLTPAVDMPAAMTGFKGRVAEFVCSPLRPVELEVALHRVDRFNTLREDMARLRDRFDERASLMAAETVEDERFLAVRQIVDRMSEFIAQVANDVHGGVKYFNELPYFVSIHSAACKILAANTTYNRYLGYRIHGNSWDIYSGKRGTRKACPVTRTLRNEDVMQTNALVKYKSGARVPVIVNTAPIFNDAGDVVMVLEIFAGSKEVEQLAEEVRSTQQRYHQLFDAVPNYVVVLDRRLNVTAVNRRFKEDFRGEIGQNFFEVLRPGSFPLFRDPVTQTVNDGMAHQGELVLTDRNGVQYTLMAWTSPIKTRAGKLIQVLIIFTDITQLRRLQSNLSSLGLMIGTISHDLKGCLTGLDAGLYFIDTGFYRDRPARIEEGLEVSKMMTDRIRKLIQNVLYYAKERKPEIQEVDAERFANEVAANVDLRIRGADIRFNCHIEPNLGTFRIDPALMRSTLINILENAIEACIEDRSTKVFEITFRVSRRDNDIGFDIIDNGSGMDRDRMKQMFNIFYSSKGREGTGLGLFIANKTVQKHGGSISVDSKPGEGTAFRIRLPRQYSG